MTRHHHRRKERRIDHSEDNEESESGSNWVMIFILATSLGCAAGVLSVPGTATRLWAFTRPVLAGAIRTRTPKPDDYWEGCNEARAAGAAPIFADEPGYREDMDGDHDGIACEPHA